MKTDWAHLTKCVWKWPLCRLCLPPSWIVYHAVTASLNLVCVTLLGRAFSRHTNIPSTLKALSEPERSFAYIYFSLSDAMRTGSIKLILVSELAYCNIRLSDFQEVGETFEDSQRVVYEDPLVELRQHNSGSESSSLKLFKTELQLSFDVESATSKFAIPTFASEMEVIWKCSGGGGTTQKSFEQDAEAVYSKMLRDHREHLLAGFGQWKFLGLLGARLQGEARGVHVAFMDTWDFENIENPILDEAQDVERRRQLWRDCKRDNTAYFVVYSNQ